MMILTFIVTFVVICTHYIIIVFDIYCGIYSYMYYYYLLLVLPVLFYYSDDIILIICISYYLYLYYLFICIYPIINV